MTKIFIASPAFDGRVHIPFAISLAETTLLLASKNIPVIYQISASGSLLCAERNRLLRTFLETDCTHILCIDSDLGWPAQAILAMLDEDKDFISGVYPTRRDNKYLFRPVKQKNDALIMHKHLIKMDYIPAGFMLIKREVIEKMHIVHKDRYFKPKQGNEPDGYALFHTEVYEGEFWGEDFIFCRLAREAGFEIWTDPLIEFDHAGVRGMLAQVLTNEKPNEKNSVIKEGNLC